MRRTTFWVTVGAALALLAGQAVFAQAATTSTCLKGAGSGSAK